jgi:hypothetical protein
MKFLTEEVLSAQQPLPVQIKKPACLGNNIQNHDCLPLYANYGGTMTGFYICSSGGK